jgi:hypothetical protein
MWRRSPKAGTLEFRAADDVPEIPTLSIRRRREVERAKLLKPEHIAPLVVLATTVKQPAWLLGLRSATALAGRSVVGATFSHAPTVPQS